jgi:hypothetical protein
MFSAATASRRVGSTKTLSSWVPVPLRVLIAPAAVLNKETKVMYRLLKIICFGVALAVVGLPLRAQEKVALLRDQSILLLSVNHTIANELSVDTRHKSKLRWLPDGGHLSYLVSDEHGALARLVITTFQGEISREVPIRPITDPPTEGMRFIEDISWLGSKTVRVEGSINPRNCEIFDFDPEERREFNWRAGACGSFVLSPDGTHTAYLGIQRQSPQEEQRDSVHIDDRVMYDGGGQIQVISGPTWARDSSKVATIERRADTGEVAVTTLTVTGGVVRVPLPQDLGDAFSLVLVDSQVVVRTSTALVAVDTAHKSLGALTDDLLGKLNAQDEMRQKAQQSKKVIDGIVREFGASEGVSQP